LRHRRRPGRPAALAGLAALSALLTPGGATAHALGADCTLRDGRVEVEAYYSDDTPARHATVRVRDANNELMAEGHTDEEGRWSFPAPPPGRYAVVVDAGAGHRTRVTLTVPPRAESDPESEPATRLSDGPPRVDFIRFPWLRAGLGVGAIAALALLARIIYRARPAPSAPPHPLPLKSRT
jgi:hypothetical protein